MTLRISMETIRKNGLPPFVVRAPGYLPNLANGTPLRAPVDPHKGKEFISVQLVEGKYVYQVYAEPIGPIQESEFSSFSMVLSFIAEKYGVKKEELLSRRREKKYVLARQEAMYLIARYGKNYAGGRFTFPEIGRLLDRDHTSVMYGCWRHAGRHGLEPVTAFGANNKKGVA